MRSYRNKDMIKYNAKVDRYFCFKSLLQCKQNNGVHIIIAANLMSWKYTVPPFPNFVYDLIQFLTLVLK